MGKVVRGFEREVSGFIKARSKMLDCGRGIVEHFANRQDGPSSSLYTGSDGKVLLVQRFIRVRPVKNQAEVLRHLQQKKKK